MSTNCTVGSQVALAHGTNSTSTQTTLDYGTMTLAPPLTYYYSWMPLPSWDLNLLVGEGTSLPVGHTNANIDALHVLPSTHIMFRMRRRTLMEGMANLSLTGDATSDSDSDDTSDSDDANHYGMPALEDSSESDSTDDEMPALVWRNGGLGAEQNQPDRTTGSEAG